MSELTILSPAMAQLGRADAYDSYIATYVYGDKSNIKITASPDINNGEFLVPKNIVHPTGDRTHPFILTRNEDASNMGEKKITVTGKDIFWLMTKRLANNTGDDITYTYQSLEYVIKDIISNVFAGDRDITYISVAANQDRGTYVNVTIPPGASLYDSIITLLAVDQMGLVTNVTGGNIEIDIYESVDRSSDNTDGNTSVVFSLAFNNLNSGTTTNSIEDVKNVAYVAGGEDETGTRMMYVVGSVTGNDLSEVFVDGGDSTDEDELELLGQAALDTDEIGGVYDVTVLTSDTETFQWGVDYYLGDIVTVAGDDLRIVQAQEVFQNETGHIIKLTFGKVIKSASARLKEVESKTASTGNKIKISFGQAYTENMQEVAAMFGPSGAIWYKAHNPVGGKSIGKYRTDRAWQEGDTHEDGTLLADITDDTGLYGNNNWGAKTGLTNGTVHYLYFFPYSTEGVYNDTYNSANAASAIAGGLLHAWWMEDNVTDSGDSVNGTPSNITYADGQVERKAVCNGSSSKITFATETITGNFTLMGWFTAGSGNATRIFQCPNNTNYTIAGATASSGKVQFTLAANYVESTIALTNGATYHIAFVRSGNVYKIYINGELNNSLDLGSAPNMTTLLLGALIAGGTTYYGTAGLDQVIEMDRDATDGEVMNEYQLGAAA